MIFHTHQKASRKLKTFSAVESHQLDLVTLFVAISTKISIFIERKGSDKIV